MRIVLRGLGLIGFRCIHNQFHVRFDSVGLAAGPRHWLPWRLSHHFSYSDPPASAMKLHRLGQAAGTPGASVAKATGALFRWPFYSFSGSRSFNEMNSLALNATNSRSARSPRLKRVVDCQLPAVSL